jgi:hypothetical protein
MRDRDQPGVYAILGDQQSARQAYCEDDCKKTGIRRVISKRGAPENLVLAVEQMLKERENAVKTTPVAVEARRRSFR